MFFRLLLLFILVPAAELVLLIEVGKRVGALPTIALIVFTGVLGATLARHQGLGVLRTIQTEMQAGRLPAAALVDGVVLLLASAVLMTPGVLTDALGFLCLVPATRRVIRAWLWRRVERAVRRGQVQMTVDLKDYRTVDEAPSWPPGGEPSDEREDSPPSLPPSDPR